MPLLAGNWMININGSEGSLRIENVSAEGTVTGTALNIPFTGFWNESGQTIFFETMVQQGGAQGSERAQFTGYLFRTPPNEVPGQDVKWTLCGYLRAPYLGFHAVQPNARRTTFGWLATINQIV